MGSVGRDPRMTQSAELCRGGGGDIGYPTTEIYRSFLYKQADQFEVVLVIAGNHEFYNRGGGAHSVEDIEEVMERLCNEAPRRNVHYVDNTCVRFGRDPSSPALLCTPLWTDVPAEARHNVGVSMNDYRICFVRSEKPVGSLRDRSGCPVEPLTVDVTVAWHHAACKWLQSEIARLEGSCDRIAVLTHHAPAMGSSAPEFESAFKEGRNPLIHGFETDLSYIYAHKAVKVWASGHTHYNRDIMAETPTSTRLVTNQFGYISHPEKDAGIAYRPTCVIEL